MAVRYKTDLYPTYDNKNQNIWDFLFPWIEIISTVTRKYLYVNM